MICGSGVGVLLTDAVYADRWSQQAKMTREGRDGALKKQFLRWQKERKKRDQEPDLV